LKPASHDLKIGAGKWGTAKNSTNPKPSRPYAKIPKGKKKVRGKKISSSYNEPVAELLNHLQGDFKKIC
jgi:hypothetical protein